MRKIFYDKWYMKAIQLEKILVTQGWKYIGSGKDRRVWQRGNVVLKIPYVSSGVEANRRERELYTMNRRRNYAPCRLVGELLMMRAVKVLDDLDPVQYDRIPYWALHLNDGPQVGIDNNGRVLIYDYAEE
jgi:hypothetical protein